MSAKKILNTCYNITERWNATANISDREFWYVTLPSGQVITYLAPIGAAIEIEDLGIEISSQA